MRGKNGHGHIMRVSSVALKYFFVPSASSSDLFGSQNIFTFDILNRLYPTSSLYNYVSFNKVTTYDMLLYDDGHDK